MSSSIAFTAPGGGDPVRWITDLAKTFLPDEAAMLYSGSQEIARIRRRTAEGSDVDGAAFAPYSPSYAKKRQKMGRNSSVDLLTSGRMLNSIQPEVRSPTVLAISITDVSAAVYGQAINEGAGKQPRRRFFDISQTELGMMRDDMFHYSKSNLASSRVQYD